MRCFSCGHENREGRRFCVECGSALALHCPACQAEVGPGQKFCGECGTALTPSGGPSPAPAATSAPGAARKTVTVLFADLGGSTGFGERSDAEITRQVLAQYHALLQEVIDAHAGTVAKFMGDGMMATFGIPEVAEDDARRAVDAAAALQERFEEFAAGIERQHREALTLRVGINTGEVVIAAGDADIIGDALNVAARLEKACRPGHVLVGEETWRLTRGEVAYEALGEVTVAGRGEPVSVYELAARRATEDVATPFVGRDPEVEQLLAVLDEAAAASAARLATVLGSPGVGKTRLSREFCARAAARADAQCVEIRCDRAGEATFAPVAQLIRESAGLGDDATAEAARAAIGTLLPETESDHARIVDVLAGLVGAAPSRSVEETFWAVRRLVEATAIDRPLVVVIDDIQWAEPLLLDLLEHLAEWVDGSAVLLLGLARPELREVRPTLAEPGRPVAAVLVLDGLDATATEALAAGLLGTDRLPAGLVERLPESTDGNPLFVRELVRMLVDDQVIRRRDDGDWELTIDAEAVDVPPTIQSLLGARVERLPAAERELLEYASVVGAEFSLGALRELAGDHTPITSLLETMRRKELVEPTGAYWGDEPVHRFHHVLIRDSAYRRILKTTRAELHEQVATWTDRTAADLIGEHEAAIAHHYEQAYRYRLELGALDEQTGDLGRRGAALLATAAQHALGRDDLAAAGALSARALTLLPESDTTSRADLLMTGCECLLASGDGAAARPLVEELSRVATGDVRLLAWAECFAAQLVGLTDPAALVAADARALAAAEKLTDLRDGSGQAKAHQVRAGLLARLGRVGDAEVELDLALAAAREADDRRRVTAVLGAAPDAALFGPSPVARAGGQCLDVVRLLRITTASPSVEAASNRCQAVLEALRGRFDVSRSMLASARASLEELGLRHGLAQTELYAGMVELIADDPHAAIPPLRAAYRGLGSLGVGADAGNAAALLARALLVDGAVDEADEMATASERLAGQNLKTAIGWRIARAEVLAARGDESAAVTLAEQAVEIAAGTDLIIDHADACVALGALRARAGDAAGARSARADARRLYEQKGATVAAARLDEPLSPNVDATHAPVSPPRAAPALPLENTASRVYAAVMDVLSSRSAGDLAELVAKEFRHDDRRRVVNYGVATLGAAAAQAEWLRTEGFQMGVPQVIAVRGDRAALTWNDTRTASGDDISSFCLVEVDRHDKLVSLTQFDESDQAQALDHLNERFIAAAGAEHGSGHSLLENTASRVDAQIIALLAAGADREMADLTAPEFELDDRRHVVNFGITDSAASQSYIEWLREEGFEVATPRVIAVRGDRLVLSRRNRRTPNGVELSSLAVTEVDGQGRLLGLVQFDEESLDDAIAELDARYIAGEGAEHAELVRGVATWIKAFNAHDYDALRNQAAPDFVVVDHRLLRARSMDLDEFIEAFSSYADVRMSQICASLRVRDRVTLVTTVNNALAPDGGEVVWVNHGVSTSRPDGRQERLELFDEQDWAAALARFDVLSTATPREPRLENTATRVHARIVAAINANDLEAQRALTTRSFVQDDRRAVVAVPDQDRTGLARYHEIMHEQGYEFLPPEPLAVRGDRLSLARVTHRTAAGDESVFLALIELDAAGWIARATSFDEADLPSAVDQLETRFIAAKAAENTASRIYARVLTVMVSQDVQELEELIAPEFQLDDRRPIVGTGVQDRAGAAEHRVIFREAGWENTAISTIAIRGDRLALCRSGRRTAAGDEGESLDLVEVDEQSRLCGTTCFGDDELAAALHELEVRYIAASQPADARTPAVANLAARVHARIVAAINANDVETQRALTTRDFAQDDRRAVVAVPDQDRRGIARYHEIMLEQGYEVLPPEPLAMRGDRLTLGRVTHRTAAGDESVLLAIIELDAHGLIARATSFDEEDLATALEELDVRFLAGEGAPDAPAFASARNINASDVADPRHPRAENSCTRVVDRFFPLVLAGRFEDAGELMREDFVRVDHRTGVSDATANGRDAYMTSLRATFDVGFTSVIVDHLAVRGDRLNLMRTSFFTDTGLELVILSVFEVDADDRGSRLSLYDPDALADAVAELEARFITSERVSGAGIRAAARNYHAFITRDWDAFRATCTPEMAVVDHRTIGWPSLTRDEYVRLLRGYVEGVPDLTLIQRKVFVAGSVTLSTADSYGTTMDGADVEWVVHSVERVNDDELIDTFELFDEHDWDTALARFDELAAPSPAPSATLPEPENAALQLFIDLLARANAHDPDGLRSLMAPGFEAVDRRSVIAGSTTTSEDFIAACLRTVEIFDELAVDRSIATRGDRLALSASRFVSRSGFDVPMLVVGETDEDGRALAIVMFDDDDLAGAMQELEDRFCAGEGAADEYAIRRLGDGVRARAARDWDAVADLYAPDLAVTDHRLLPYDATDRQTFITMQRSLVDLVPDLSHEYQTIELRGDTGIAAVAKHGVSTDGSAVAWEFWFVWRSAAGRVAVIDIFDPADHAAAHARFENLAAEPRTPIVDNHLVRITTRRTWLFGFEPESVPEIYRADVVLEDRRRGMNAGTVVGAQGVRESVSTGTEIFGSLVLEPMAVRGDHLALFHWAYQQEGGFEAPGLTVIEVDDDDLAYGVTSFDEDDLDAATEFLDARYAELQREQASN